MARTINRLSDRFIRSIKKPGDYPDGHGLLLQVTSEDGKSWLLRYTLNKRVRWMGLGSLKDVSLAEARDDRDKYRRLLRSHIDPLEHRSQERAANRRSNAYNISFAEAVEQALPALTSKSGNAKHIAQWGMTLRQYAVPALGKMFVRDITVHDIKRCLDTIWMKRNETASRLRSRIERVIDWCRVNGYCEGDNPARWEGNLSLLMTETGEARNHPAMAYTELPAFMAELRKEKSTTARALEFCILTAARSQEVALATSDEIDAGDALWTVPAGHMKLKRPHLVPLSKRALQLAADACSEGNQLLFAMPDGAMRFLLRRMGYTNNATVHGFRATFKTWAVEQAGFDNYVSEAALAHAIGDKVEGAYARTTFLEKRRRLMDAWANFCAGVTDRKGNITQLHAR